ncbi:MAG: hypothetical protein WC959_08295 [Kiritimatiellales bacterium]
MNAEEIVLRNANAEAVVRPDIGRVISFRRAGGENRLWVAEDPVAFGNAVPLYGGVKILVAPELFWKQIRGRHLPDAETDGSPWTVLEKTDGSVTLKTFVKDVSASVCWRITLDAEQPVLTMDYTVERAGDNPFPVYLWSVAQAPLRGDVYVSREPHVEDIFANCIRQPALDEQVTHYEDLRALKFSGTGITVPLKLGSYGQWLAKIEHGEAFIICAPAPEKKPYLDGSNLQVFSWDGRYPFYEMEVTSPVHFLRAGESFSTQEKWLLTEISGSTPEEIIQQVQSKIQQVFPAAVKCE